MYNEYKYNEKLLILRSLIDSESTEMVQRCLDELNKLRLDTMKPERAFAKMTNQMEQLITYTRENARVLNLYNRYP